MINIIIVIKTFLLKLLIYNLVILINLIQIKYN